MIEETTLSNVLAWSIQVTLLTVAAAILPRVLRIEAPAIRHAWWRVVLLLCLALPLIQPWQVTPAVALEAPPMDLTPVFSQSGTPSHAGVRPAALLPPTSSQAWPAVLGVIFLAGVLARFTWLTAGLVRLRRLRAAGERAEPTEGQKEITALTDAGAEIRYVPLIGQPVTFGVRRAIVLLPASIRCQPDPVQRAVLAHELWHVRRRDWMWFLVEECLVGLLWFHPAIWYLVARVQSSREEVVDELTILATNARRSYIEALLAFADEPPLFAAAPFARRRHLFQRMLLISRESVMSPTRIVASTAVMGATVLLTGWYGVAAFPLTASRSAAQAQVAPRQPTMGPHTMPMPGTAGPATRAAASQLPPRDQKPREPGPPTNRELELQKAIAESTVPSASTYLELAKIQEQRGALADAESTLLAARGAVTDPSSVLSSLAAFYLRINQFDKAIAVLEDTAAADPSNPKLHQVVAVYYWEKAFKDTSLTPSEKMNYIQAGIAASDRALTYDPDFVEALTYKSILLRMQAGMVTDRVSQADLTAQADALRNRAMELNKARGTSGRGGGAATRDSMPPPPPPPPPPGNTLEVDGQQPIRVGGPIAPPTKIKDVRPVYPADAQETRVQGVVIVEAVIDTAGNVRTAKILRSIPMLDQAALEAVQQWKFTPTLLNGEPVPVVMTVTVNFTLQ